MEQSQGQSRVLEQQQHKKKTMNQLFKSLRSLALNHNDSGETIMKRTMPPSSQLQHRSPTPAHGCTAEGASRDLANMISTPRVYCKVSLDNSVPS
jgi:hypothetical protein